MIGIDAKLKLHHVLFCTFVIVKSVYQIVNVTCNFLLISTYNHVNRHNKMSMHIIDGYETLKLTI